MSIATERSALPTRVFRKCQTLPFTLILVVACAWLIVSLSFLGEGYREYNFYHGWATDRVCTLSEVELDSSCNVGPGAGGTGYMYIASTSECASAMLRSASDCGETVLAGRSFFIDGPTQPPVVVGKGNDVSCAVDPDCSKFEFRSVYDMRRKLSFAMLLTGVGLTVPLAIAACCALPVVCVSCVGMVKMLRSDYVELRSGGADMQTTVKTLHRRASIATAQVFRD
ncbi:hypothetical protein DIPPA_19467 [Diplonema papillatum]|nr:hypothetical protein DIPPA_19467 [Diplonema papillatum]